MDQILQKYADTPTGSSSSYFDFVDEKADMRCAGPGTTATDMAESGKDAFVVQVMDEETSRALKQRYFNGQAFPSGR